MRILRPCKTTAAYECLPERELRWDLDAAERALVARGWALVVNAAVMLIVRKDVECSLYASGKVLLKTREPDVARQTAAALLSDLGEEPEMRIAERPREAA